MARQRESKAAPELQRVRNSIEVWRRTRLKRSPIAGKDLGRGHAAGTALGSVAGDQCAGALLLIAEKTSRGEEHTDASESPTVRRNARRGPCGYGSARWSGHGIAGDRRDADDGAAVRRHAGRHDSIGRRLPATWEMIQITVRRKNSVR